jgi:hypothetical protein
MFEGPRSFNQIHKATTDYQGFRVLGKTVERRKSPLLGNDARNGAPGRRVAGATLHPWLLSNFGLDWLKTTTSAQFSQERTDLSRAPDLHAFYSIENT